MIGLSALAPIALKGKFELFGDKLHDFDVVGAMMILNYIPLEPRGCGGSNGTAREFRRHVREEPGENVSEVYGGRSARGSSAQKVTNPRINVATCCIGGRDSRISSERDDGNVTRTFRRIP